MSSFGAHAHVVEAGAGPVQHGEQFHALLDHEAAFVVVGQAPVRYWFDDAIS
jgi:hypothetical protein